MKITQVLLLALTLPCAALAADRNDIQSCYERNGLTDIEPAGTGRELVVIIDQTIPMPDDLQRSSWGQIERFVQAGDRVMVMEGGHATLVFADGCELPVAAGSLLEVPAASPCAGQVAQVQSIGPSYAQAVGDRGGNNMNWLFGVAAVGTFYWLNKDGYSIISPPSPASP